MASTTIDPLTFNGSVTSFVSFAPWTAPTECSTIYLGEKEGPRSGLSAFDAGYGMFGNTNMPCNPPEATSIDNTWHWDGRVHTTGTTSYEVGKLLGPFSCPDDWYKATTFSISPSLIGTYCCPSGYDPRVSGQGAATNFEHDCISTLTTTSSLVYAYIYIPSDGNTDSTTYSTTTYQVLTGSRTTDRDNTMDYMTLRYDVAASAIAGYNLASATASPRSSSGSDSDTSSSGLSTGTKAGIGAGVGVGVLAFLALLRFFYIVRRRKRQNESTMTSPGENATELETSDRLYPSELEGKNGGLPRELHNRTDAPELEGENIRRQELEGVNNWPPVELDGGNDTRR